jgi:para-nitrobenzyl esterase
MEVFAAGEQNDVPLLAGWTSAEAKWWAPTLEELQSAIQERFPADAQAAANIHYAASTDAEARRAGVTMGSDGFVVFPTWKWIEMQSAFGRAPAFRYVFDQVLATPEGPVPDDDLGAAHATDIPFVFNTMGFLGNPVGAADQEVSDLMIEYWTTFAQAGDPNAEGLPEWPAWGADGSHYLMRLNAAAGAEPESDRARFEFLDALDSAGR